MSKEGASSTHSTDSNSNTDSSGGDDDSRTSSKQGSPQLKPINSSLATATTTATATATAAAGGNMSPPPPTATVVAADSSSSSSGGGVNGSCNCVGNGNTKPHNIAPLCWNSKELLGELLLKSRYCHEVQGDAAEPPSKEPLLSAGIISKLINSNDRPKKAWGDLLLKQPRRSKNNSNTMLSWIQDVLRVSNLEEVAAATTTTNDVVAVVVAGSGAGVGGNNSNNLDVNKHKAEVMEESELESVSE